MRRWLGAAFCVVTALVSSSAAAGIIGDENGKPGTDGRWPARNDGSAATSGVVDVYPAKWSIAQGDPIALKVRSTTGYSVRVFRLGFYGGKGQREVKLIEGQPANPQPYPATEGEFGLSEARWKDSVTIPTDASWTPGVYVARIERSDGLEAVTFFVIRDDKLATKFPILAVISTATHASYNAWPGMNRGGKSLYDFNSAVAPVKGSLYNAAVRVSFDRPFFVGAGTADLGNQEYPAIRFLERNGWDVAFVTDQDLHENPGIMLGRKAIVVLGHAEYWSRQMFEGGMAARDSGVNVMFMTGNTLGWQVRFEPGPNGPSSTMIGYKNSFIRDPENRAAMAALNAGNVEEAKKHFRLVTRGWRQLAYMPEHGIDERHPSMLLTGIQSTAMLPGYPWGDLEITNPTHWLFKDTGVKKGDRIKNVMGYEVDSTKFGDPEWDRFRPKTQVRIGTIRKTADDSAQGSAGYYSQDLGGGRFSEVIALSAINFSWALDGWPHGTSEPESDIAKKMVNNALARWTSSTRPTDPGSGLDEDPNKDGTGDPNGDHDNGDQPRATGDSGGDGGCAISPRDLRRHDPRRGEALLGWFTLAAFALRRFRRRPTRGGPSRSSSY